MESRIISSEIMKLFLYLIVYIFPWVCYCQTPEIEAIYYNQKGLPYMIDRMYKDESDDSKLYISHSNKNSYAIRNKNQLSNDTLILQQEYFLLEKPENRMERYSKSHIQLINSNMNGDTITIHFYDYDIHGQDSLIGDTTLIQSDIIKFNNFSEALKNDRVTLILNGEINPEVGNRTPNEIVKSYFINGKIIKAEWIDSKFQVYSFVKFNYSKNYIISCHYSLRRSLSPELYKKDSITWNTDTSNVTWIKHRLDWKKDYRNDYVINDTLIQIWEGDSLLKETIFHNKFDFKYFLWNEIVNFDALTEIDLLNFQHIQKKAICLPKSGTILTKFEFDKNGRIVKENHSKNGKPGLFVTYTYK